MVAATLFRDRQGGVPSDLNASRGSSQDEQSTSFCELFAEQQARLSAQGSGANLPAKSEPRSSVLSPSPKKLKLMLSRMLTRTKVAKATAADLRDAVEADDVNRVAAIMLAPGGLKAALKPGPPPTYFTIAHVAARSGRAEILRQVLFKLLLAEKAGRLPRHTVCMFVNTKEADSRLTPLMAACREGHAAVVAELLEYGADPMARVRNGNMALHLAAARGHAGCIDALLSRDTVCVDRIWRPAAELRSHHRKLADMFNVHGITALHLAAFHNRPTAMLALLSRKARTHYTTALPVNLNTLRGGISPQQRNDGAGTDDGDEDQLAAASTAMHCAVAGGAVECVRVLLAAQIEGLGTLRLTPREAVTPGVLTRRDRGIDLRRFVDGAMQSPELLAVMTPGLTEGVRGELIRLTQVGTSASEALGDWGQARILGPAPLSQLALSAHMVHLHAQLDALDPPAAQLATCFDVRIHPLPSPPRSDAGGEPSRRRRSSGSEDEAACVGPSDSSEDEASRPATADATGEPRPGEADRTPARPSDDDRTRTRPSEDEPARPPASPPPEDEPAAAAGPAACGAGCRAAWGADLEECTICMDEDAKLAVRGCGHAFCGGCLRRMMGDPEGGAPLCPMCRTPIAGFRTA